MLPFRLLQLPGFASDIDNCLEIPSMARRYLIGAGVYCWIGYPIKVVSFWGCEFTMRHTSY